MDGKRYCRELEAGALGSPCRIHGSPGASIRSHQQQDPEGEEQQQLPIEDGVDAFCGAFNTISHHCPELHKAIEGIRYIADHTKRDEDSTRVSLSCVNSRLYIPYLNTFFFCFYNLYRSRKIGNTLQWCWTDCSCGSFAWPWWWEPRVSYCKHQRCTTTVNPSTFVCLRLHQPLPNPTSCRHFKATRMLF